MATHTVVTANAMTAVTFSYAPATLSAADLATVNLAIKDDLNVSHPRMPNYFVREGMLFIPNRDASVQILPGDVICVTSRGFPILISADEIANGTTFTYT
jgi:hypothetical protein